MFNICICEQQRFLYAFPLKENIIFENSPSSVFIQFGGVDNLLRFLHRNRYLCLFLTVCFVINRSENNSNSKYSAFIYIRSSDIKSENRPEITFYLQKKVTQNDQIFIDNKPLLSTCCRKQIN